MKNIIKIALLSFVACTAVTQVQAPVVEDDGEMLERLANRAKILERLRKAGIAQHSAGKAADTPLVPVPAPADRKKKDPIPTPERSTDALQKEMDLVLVELKDPAGYTDVYARIISDIEVLRPELAQKSIEKYCLNSGKLLLSDALIRNGLVSKEVVNRPSFGIRAQEMNLRNMFVDSVKYADKNIKDHSVMRGDTLTNAEKYVQRVLPDEVAMLKNIYWTFLILVNAEMQKAAKK